MLRPIFNNAATTVEIKNLFSCLFGIRIEYVKKHASVAKGIATANILTTTVPLKYSYPPTKFKILSASRNKPTVVGRVNKIKMSCTTLSVFLYSLSFFSAIYAENLGNVTIITEVNKDLIIE